MSDTIHDLHASEQAEILYNQALDLFDQKRYTECLVLIDKAILLDRGNTYLYYARGNTRCEMGDIRGAAADYAWALRRAPFFADAATNLGYAYHRLKKYQQSLMLYERAQALDPENAHIHFNRGNALADLGRLEESVEALSRAIELAPDMADAYLNRGNTLSRLGQHQAAMRDYHQAAFLDCQDSNIQWTVSWAHFEETLITPKMAQDLARIADLNPDHYTSLCCRALIALQRSDLQATLLYLEQAVKMEPKEWDPHFWISVVSAMAGEEEIARQAIEHAIELGLPPILLTPLLWLRSVRPGFFEKSITPLLQRVKAPSPAIAAVVYTQVAGELVVAAMRDPADIIDSNTLWEFTQLIEAFSALLSNQERQEQPYQQLAASIQRLYGPMLADVTPAENDQYRLGPTVIEAFAAYIEEAAALVVTLLESRPPALVTPLFQRFQQIMQQFEREIAEVPGEAPVQHALSRYQACLAFMKF